MYSWFTERECAKLIRGVFKKPDFLGREDTADLLRLGPSTALHTENAQEKQKSAQKLWCGEGGGEQENGRGAAERGTTGTEGNQVEFIADSSEKQD